MRVKLREVRERKFITQEELSARTGMSVSNISRVENGLQRPRITTVRKLAAALGIDPEELVEWEAEAETTGQGKAAA